MKLRHYFYPENIGRKDSMNTMKTYDRKDMNTMKNIHNLHDLHELAVNISPYGTSTVKNRIENIVYPIKETDRRVYNFNQRVTTFVDETGVYAIPTMNFVKDILCENDFSLKRDLYLYFDDGYIPFYENKKWSDMLQMQYDMLPPEEKKVISFERNCIAVNFFAGTIAQDLLEEKCLKVPLNGYHYTPRDASYVYVEKPKLTPASSHEEIRRFVGRYYINNGVFVFVYKDGNTYVSTSSQVFEALANAGYKEYPLRVPLSNNESIVEKEIAEKWEAVKLAS